MQQMAFHLFFNNNRSELATVQKFAQGLGIDRHGRIIGLLGLVLMETICVRVWWDPDTIFQTFRENIRKEPVMHDFAQTQSPGMNDKKSFFALCA